VKFDIYLFFVIYCNIRKDARAISKGFLRELKIRMVHVENSCVYVCDANNTKSEYL